MNIELRWIYANVLSVLTLNRHSRMLWVNKSTKVSEGFVCHGRGLFLVGVGVNPSNYEEQLTHSFQGGPSLSIWWTEGYSILKKVVTSESS